MPLQRTLLPPRAGIVIVGAGVIGSSIAREATRYTRDVVILEKERKEGASFRKLERMAREEGVNVSHVTIKKHIEHAGVK